MTSSVVGPRRSSKVRPKAKLAPKKVMVTVLWSAASLIHYSFLNPSKTITSEVCSADRWDAPETAMFTASISQRNDPSSSPWQCLATHHTTNTSKVEWIGLQSFASSTMFTWPLTKWLSLLQASWQLFAEKTLPQPAGGRKSFPRALQILKLRFLCYRNKQTFLIGKSVLIVMLPILINKDVWAYLWFKMHGLKPQLLL